MKIKKKKKVEEIPMAGDGKEINSPYKWSTQPQENRFSVGTTENVNTHGNESIDIPTYLKAMVDVGGVFNYPLSVVGAGIDAYNGDYAGAVMGLVPIAGKSGLNNSFWRNAYTKAVNNGVPHTIAKPIQKYGKKSIEGISKSIQATDLGFDLTESNNKKQNGGSINKYPNGGRQPIIVNDINDPRLKAYNDSLSLHNLSMDNRVKVPLGSSSTNDPFLKKTNNNEWEAMLLRKRLVEQGLKRNPEVNKIRESLGYNNSEPEYSAKIGFDTFHVYKKPVQPVIYQKPQPKPFKPIIVTDPNDPRLKAYEDSTTAYNWTQNRLKKGDLNPDNGVLRLNDINPDIFEKNEPDLAQASFGKIRPIKVRHYSSDSKGELYIMEYKKPVQPIVIGRPKDPLQLNQGQQLLPESSKNINFNPIPYEQGTYFSRPRQQQEMGATEYFDKKTGKPLSKFQDGGRVLKDKFNNPIKSKLNFTDDVRSNYDHYLNQINLGQDYKNANKEEKDNILAHEGFHEKQYDTGKASYPEYFKAPFKKPNLLHNDDMHSDFYNRKSIEVNMDIDRFNDSNPSFNFIPRDLIYDKVVDYQQYNNPYSMEGEAQRYQETGKFQNGGTTPIKQDGGTLPPKIGKKEYFDSKTGKPLNKFQDGGSVNLNYGGYISYKDFKNKYNK